MTTQIQVEEPDTSSTSIKTGLLADVSDLLRTLEQTDIDIQTKLDILLKVKTVALSIQGNDLLELSTLATPILLDLLRTTTPTLEPNSVSQKLRLTSLEVLQAVSAHEGQSTWASEMFDVLVVAIGTDSEENTMLALKVLISVFKLFRQSLKESLHKFIDIVIQMYRNMEDVVKDKFGESSEADAEMSIDSSKPESEDGTNEEAKLTYGKYSFKVITECPIIVVLFFQSNPEFASSSVPNLVDLLLKFAALVANVPWDTGLQAKNDRKEIAREPQDTESLIWLNYCDFLVAQVKTISFLAYLLRGHSYISSSVQGPIASIIFRLLRNLPSRLSSARKELLVATRHILLTDCRSSFVQQIDDFFEEKLLTGEGLTAVEILRPLALNILADLLHNIRASLTDEQTEKVVLKYCSLIHEQKLPIGVQSISVKLILNFVEKIVKMQNTNKSYQLLITITANLIKRLETIKESIQADKCLKAQSKSEDAMDVDKLQEIDHSTYLQQSLAKLNKIKLQSVSNNESTKDLRVIFRTIIIGLKSFIFGIKSVHPLRNDFEENDPSTLQNVRSLISTNVFLFRKLLREGIQCFELYPSDSKDVPKENSNGIGFVIDQLAVSFGSTFREDKDVLEIFSNVLTLLDPATFIEVWELEMPFFFSEMLKNTNLIHIPQYLLSNESTSKNFLSIAMKFLMKNINDIGSHDPIKSALMVRFFRNCFMTVTLYPSNNESVLVTYVSEIIYKCIQSSSSNENSTTYFILLKYLFRAVGGGRFDHVSKEVMPLLQVLLECLNMLLSSAMNNWEKELYAELCLFIPVRLSALLPYMYLLMNPLIAALRARSDLVGQGLRTLELCLDNLTKDFFDPIMSSVVDELMEALQSHLKPLPYNHQYSHNAVKILGKLGGRNRKHLSGNPVLNVERLNFSSNFIKPMYTFTFQGVNKSSALPYCDFLPYISEMIKKKQFDDDSVVDAYNYLEITLRKLIEPLMTNRCNFENIAELRSLPDSILNASIPSVNISSFKDFNFEITNNKAVTIEHDSNIHVLLGSCIENICNLASENDETNKHIKTLLNAVFSLLIYYDAEWMIQIRKDNADIVRLQNDLQFVLVSKLRSAFTNAFINVLSKMQQSGNKIVFTVLDEYLRLIKEMKLDCINFSKSDCQTMHQMIQKFCHTCFQKLWNMKAAGTLGLQFFVTKFLLTNEKWFREYHLQAIKALLFVIKDDSYDLPNSIRQTAAEVMKEIISFEYEVEPQTNEKQESSADEQKGTEQAINESGAKNQKRPTDELISTLVLELSSSNQFVRELIQEHLKIIANNCNCTLTSLIVPFQDQLLTPIFKKPLRALPFSMQISHINAVTFCMTLKPTLLNFSEELLRLLHEALALAYADDEALMTVSRTSQHKTASYLVKLRAVCLKLLSAALSIYDFSSPTLVQTKTKIIGVFFKCLYMKSPEIVEVANVGIKNVLTQYQKLPKELLQGGLRPILMNISDHKRLTVEGLEGLARLLELLTNYFKVEIGRKLLDHLKAWSTPQALKALANCTLNSQNTINIISSILNVFHLLPPQANQFLSEIIESVMTMEPYLKRSQHSPLRVPLIKYLDRYSTDTISYFLSDLDSEDKLKFFSQILAHEKSQPLRSELAKKFDVVETKIKASLAQKQATIFFQLIDITVILLENEEESLSKSNLFNLIDNDGENLLIVTVLQNFKTMQKVVGPTESIACFKISKDIDQLVKLRLSSKCGSKVTRQELFLLVRYIGECSELLSPNVVSYLREYIVEKLTYTDKIALVHSLLKLFTNIQITQEFKVFLFRQIINPIFAIEAQSESNDIESKEKILKAFGESAHEYVIAPAFHDFGDDILCHGALKIELLQLCALLISERPDLFSNFKDDILNFARNFTKVEDSTIKYAAYVVIAMCIANFDTPEPLLLDTSQALLRACQAESRTLVKQALDILSPKIPSHLAQNSKSDLPVFIGWINRIGSEDNGSISIIANVLHFVVRNGDFLYTYRQSFLLSIGTALHKLAFQPNSTAENKEVALKTAELIVEWRKREIDSNGKDDSQILSSADFHDQILAFLIRLTCLSSDIFLRPGTSQRCINLLELLLDKFKWLYRNDSLTIFEKILTQLEINDQNLHTIVNALKCLQLIVNYKSQKWLVDHITTLRSLIDKSLSQENVVIQTIVQPTIRSILAATRSVNHDEKSDADSLGAQLRSVFSTFVQECLQTNSNRCIAGVLTLETLLQDDISLCDLLLPLLVKTFAKLVKDCIFFPKGTNSTAQSNKPNEIAESQAHVNNASAASHQSNVGITNQETLSSHLSSDGQTNFLLTCLEILKFYVKNLGEQRRYFLSTLLQLVERSPSTVICLEIVKIMREWIFESKEPFPSIKEKTLLLLKMTSFQNRNNPELLHELLKLVLDIYREPSLSSTELAVRLEQAFLAGTQVNDYCLRNQFMIVFDLSMVRNLYTRVNYVIGIQNWELIGPTYWIIQGNRLIIGSIAEESQEKSELLPLLVGDGSKPFFESLLHSSKAGLRDHEKTLLRSLSRLQCLDNNMAHALWKCIFSEAWKVFSRKERQELSKALIAILAKDYHIRQMHSRPNAPQTLLETISLLGSTICIPPHLVRYIGTTFNAHYSALTILEAEVTSSYNEDADSEREMIANRAFDALVETYASLSEGDMFHGAWRRHAQYLETYTAISYEQNEIWDKAQLLYEAAQIKARSGVIPFSESEYNLWEDHWIICAQKLQQWDILSEMAKYEGYTELILECAWRLNDWNNDREQIESYLKLLSDNPSPRRYTFEALLLLQKILQNNSNSTGQSGESIEEDLPKLVDEVTQILLHKWHQLPHLIGNAHVPLLQNFQQVVELQEAASIYLSLSNMNAQNSASKAMEIKSKLQVWRERLPNVWDDINAWGDLVAWRQHVFQSINKVYLPVVSQQNSTPQGSLNGSESSSNNHMNNSSSPSMYRGYHEIAWIINRFAHVARKHQLTEVCINQLNRIYTLPNIEIQEAFLKLKEQAKCLYENNSDLQQGLDVISNTNLMYFGARQKAEFFALKGMFLTKLKHSDEANQAFATAVQIDLTLAKAWAEWGRHNDILYSESSSNINAACNAVSCYLQAAGLYQNSKARKYLGRVLWLLTFDDEQGSVSKAFDSYRGEIPIWYWITFIPQLLTSLSHKEARHMRNILARISKTYPQALHFQLRTTRDDFFVIKKQALTAAQKAEQMHLNSPSNNGENKSTVTSVSPSPGNSKVPNSGEKQSTASTKSNSNLDDNASESSQSSTSPKTASKSSHQAPAPSTPHSQEGEKPTSVGAKAENSKDQPNSSSGDNSKHGSQSESRHTNDMSMRQPWEYVDDIISFLKTAYPLLALTMEKMVDQIQTKFKSPPEEDAYRLVVALLNDGVQYIGRIGNLSENTQLPGTTQANILRFAESVLPKSIKTAFENEFVHAEPNLQSYVEKLRRWRDRFEYILDSRDTTMPLEEVSPWLCEFHYSQLDDVEIPGQYLQHKDNNNDFIKISRFLPDLALLRGQGMCYRRLAIAGHDGSTHYFSVQYPAARHCRREERILQLFRIFDEVLKRKRQTRKRNLSFDLPWAVPLAPHIRIFKDDPTYVTFQNIFEEHCKLSGISKDEPLKVLTEKMRIFSKNTATILNPTEEQKIQQRSEALTARVEILEYIQRHLAPANIFETYFQNLYTNNMDFWLFRRAFSLNYAALTFIMYIMSINLRFPHKFFISRADGRVLGTELLPAMASNNPVLFNGEAVPFRLTPNVQYLIGPIGIEGVYASALMAIAKSFSEPEFDLEHHLTIFVRDELIWWFTQQYRPVLPEAQFKEKMMANIDQMKRRVVSLSQNAPGNLPANQTIIDFISQAVNPRCLAQMDQLWAAWI